MFINIYMTKLFLYILTDPDKPHRCKVGITKKPDQRIRAYKTANPQCKFSFIREIPHKRIEKEVLYHLKGVFRVDSEYVWSNPTIVQNIIEGLFDDL